MNRTSNLHKTTKAKPTTQIKYEHSSVETTTNPSSEPQPLKLGNQSIHNVTTTAPPPPKGFKAPYSPGTVPSMTGKEKHSHASDSHRMKEPDFGHPKGSSNSNNLGYYDDNTKFKRQGSSYTKPYSEDIRGNSYQSPTRSPLQGSQSFSKSHQPKRGDSHSSSAFKSTNENNNHKGKLFTQPYVPRSQYQTGPPHHQQQQHHQHHQQQYGSPDMNYLPTSPILTVAHSPGSSVHAQHHHSYGIQYTTQGPVPSPQAATIHPASPRSSAHSQQLSPSLPVPTAPIPIPHTWSASAIPAQYYAVPGSMYDPQQIQYHPQYYSPYQYPLQHPHSSVYGYIPSLTPPLQSQPQQQQHYQASSPVSPLIQHQKSPGQSHTTTTTHHASPSSRSSKAIPIINPNTMTPVQTELHHPSTNTTHASKEPQKPVVSAIPTQFVDPAIKEQEEREQQERLEEEEQLCWEQRQQQQQQELDSQQKDDKSATEIEGGCTEIGGTTTTTELGCLPTDDTHVEVAVETTEITSTDASKTTTTADQVSPSNTTIDGVIQYDPAFLMQFMPLCLETAEDLSSFQNIVDIGPPNDKQRQNSFNNGGGIHLDKANMFRPGSHGNNSSNYSRSAPNGAAAMALPSHNHTGRTEMGKFIGGRTLTGRTLGNTPSHYTSTDYKMQREDSSGARTRINASSNRSGTNHHPNNNTSKQRYPSHDHHHHHHQGAPTIPYEQVAPLEKSANRWVPSILAAGTPATTTTTDLLPQDEITRKVKALLNKLTLERFDTISDKIISYAEQSIHETDGQSLRTVIQLIFEKACDEAAFASMWAQLCRKLYEWIPATIKDVNTKDKNDDVMCGIPLYCKYLLSRCQYEFEKGWKSIPDKDAVDTEVMLTDEYYNAVKIKRQGLGLVQFIGELYLREMLSQRIMYQCLKQLCDSGSDAHEEEVESLCKLLTTVGADIDRNPQTATWIDFFFKRMKSEMYNSPKLSSRVKFMILDVFDLRKSNWVPRNGTQDGPKTIAEIHEEAEKAKFLEKDALAKRTARGHTSSTHHLYNGSNRQPGTFRNMGSKSMKRSGSGGLAGTSPPRHDATDYSNFGRAERSRSRTNVLEPYNSPFPSLMNRATQSKSGKPSFKDASNGTTFSNMFSALGTHDDDIDPERKKVTLLSRKPAIDTPFKKPSPKTLDPVQLKRRIKNTLAEYYEMADTEELFTSIKELDQPDTQATLAAELLAVIELKEKQVVAVADLIPQLYKAHLLDRETMVKSFQTLMDGYEELTIDVPQAPASIARLLIQAGIGLSDIAGPTPPSSLQQALSLL